ncbi:SDR family NAD(P)-dependent oxidoreductase [Burkholderia gladioli]|uniref:SDR family NAD(P)-dependent oxidoreductase n=1 Tax=Burkholderia gladioli TaxID=28095 RepID=UPI00163EA968|nr:SDR family NAD(P)-dependent oxidoreductase [Burkholderia gladioli]
MQTWFITGASRGFGLEIARAALAAGNKVIATARDRQHLETVSKRCVATVNFSLDLLT